jgi:uncharacterized protein YbcI
VAVHNQASATRRPVGANPWARAPRGAALERPEPAAGQLNAAIVRAVVRVYRTHRGRGPTKGQAFHRDNVIVVVLAEAMNAPERSLVAHGHHAAARTVARELQAAMRDDLIAAVEPVSGRKVSAVLSDTDVTEDVAAVVFVLDAPVAMPPGQHTD